MPQLKTIAFVLGTRPEAIKLAPVILACERRRPLVRASVINTGQHGNMVEPVLEFFGVRPSEDLQVMTAGHTLHELTARAMTQIGESLLRVKPDSVVVQGDTTTAMCAALSAFYLKIPVAHVEAGLRTDNWFAPFPEEVNRRVIAQVASWHFAPTVVAARALERDAIAALGGRVLVTGNTVIDALHLALQRIRRRGTGDGDVARAQTWYRTSADHRVLLVTGHRRESFGRPFEQLCIALRELAVRHPKLLIVYPVHLNPNVQAPVRRILSGLPNVLLVEPKPYPAFVELMLSADAVLTDSGGVQEEAPALGLPVLVTREQTERPEAMQSGAARLVGTSRPDIVNAIEATTKTKRLRRRRVLQPSPYGDGKAAGRCLAALLGEKPRAFRG